MGLTTDARTAAPAIFGLLTPALAGGADGSDPNALDSIAADSLALARLLIDRALDAGAPDRAGLEDRLVGALAGYLCAAGVAD